MGHCEFDKENTRLFFDLVDRQYNKEGNFNIVFTSNKNPSEWRGNFNEDDAMRCAIDRIFNTATVIIIKGNSFRGANCETYLLCAIHKSECADIYRKSNAVNILKNNW